MDHLKQIESFENDLDNLVARYAAEYDMRLGAMIGSLQIKTAQLCDQANEPQDAKD